MNEPKPLLTAHNLTRFYEVSQGLFQPPAVVKALDGVSFSVVAGKTLAVVGESGCGKSTLARQVTMIERATSGQLEFDGFDLVKASDHQLKNARKRVQMIFQNPFGSLKKKQRDFSRQSNRFQHPAVVGFDVFGKILIKKNFLG